MNRQKFTRGYHRIIRNKSQSFQIYGHPESQRLHLLQQSILKRKESRERTLLQIIQKPSILKPFQFIHHHTHLSTDLPLGTLFDSNCKCSCTVLTFCPLCTKNKRHGPTPFQLIQEV